MNQIFEIRSITIMDGGTIDITKSRFNLYFFPKSLSEARLIGVDGHSPLAGVFSRERFFGVKPQGRVLVKRLKYSIHAWHGIDTKADSMIFLDHEFKRPAIIDSGMILTMGLDEQLFEKRTVEDIFETSIFPEKASTIQFVG